MAEVALKEGDLHLFLSVLASYSNPSRGVHFAGDVSSCLSDSNARLCGKSRNRHAKKAGAQESAKNRAEELIPLTVPEVCRLLWWLVWGRVPEHEQVIHWSHWRRQHQAVAKRCHYNRRLAQTKHLQL
jgi:hypothetical protein